MNETIKPSQPSETDKSILRPLAAAQLTRPPCLVCEIDSNIIQGDFWICASCIPCGIVILSAFEQAAVEFQKKGGYPVGDCGLFGFDLRQSLMKGSQ